MITHSFGDRNGVNYSKVRETGKDENNNSYFVVDHVDMDKTNNSVENLEIISYGLNLYRAAVRYPQTKSTVERFTNYRNNLSEFRRYVLDNETLADHIRGVK